MATTHYSDVEWLRWLAARVGYATRRTQAQLHGNEYDYLFGLADSLLAAVGDVLRPDTQAPLQHQLSKAPVHVRPMLGLLTAIADRKESSNDHVVPLADPPMRTEALSECSLVPQICLLQKWWRARLAARRALCHVHAAHDVSMDPITPPSCEAWEVVESEDEEDEVVTDLPDSEQRKDPYYHARFGVPIDGKVVKATVIGIQLGSVSRE